MKSHRGTNCNKKYDDLPDWVRPTDAVSYLNISRSALYELLRTKAIPSKRLGRSIRIPKAALNPSMQEMANV